MFIPLPVIALPPLVDDHQHGDEMLLPDVDAPISTDPVRIQLVRHEMPFVNAANYPGHNAVKTWQQFVGQEPMKAQLQVFIDDALERNVALPHVLLASGMPGVGKTTLAQLVATQVGSRLVKLVPPFTPQTLYDAALGMDDWEFLFVDEIHKLGDHGPSAAENLLHLLEEKVLYLDDGVHELADFTVIGATTDADKLPETIIDRFVIKPYFQRYSLPELVRITKNFCDDFGFMLDPKTMVAIAKACRGTPRVARELVEGARALSNSYGRSCMPDELLAFKELDPDGLTRQHAAYLTSLRRFFGREKPQYGTGAPSEWEFVAGEASLMNILRENKPGLARLERFLIEKGLVDRTPRGRRLTDRGIARADTLISQGKGIGIE